MASQSHKMCVADSSSSRHLERRYSSTILVVGTRWRRLVSVTPHHFTHEEGGPDTHWIGGLVGPKASLDAVE
jgi:hypothetical protein